MSPEELARSTLEWANETFPTTHHRRRIMEGLADDHEAKGRPEYAAALRKLIREEANDA